MRKQKANICLWPSFNLWEHDLAVISRVTVADRHQDSWFKSWQVLTTICNLFIDSNDSNDDWRPKKITMDREYSDVKNRTKEVVYI